MVTPLLIVLLLFTNDFVTMSIATDHVSFSQRPDRWKIRSLMVTAIPLAGLIVTFSLTMRLAGRNLMRFSASQIQTLAFLTLVFSGQGTVYLVRERSHFWRSRPSRWMVVASLADLAGVGYLAIAGVWMTALPAVVVGGLLGAVVLYLFIIDFLKIQIFRRSGVA